MSKEPPQVDLFWDPGLKEHSDDTMISLRVLFLFICWIIIFPSLAWVIWEILTLRLPGAIQGAIEWQSVATMANIHMFSHQDELHWPQFGELRSFRAILKYEPTQINRSNFTIQALS